MNYLYIGYMQNNEYREKEITGTVRPSWKFCNAKIYYCDHTFTTIDSIAVRSPF